MGLCPICNGFKELNITCPSCRHPLEDEGRIMDFYDDYSPYMPIDQMKLEDGFPIDLKEEQCPHLFKCIQCGYEEIKLIYE